MTKPVSRAPDTTSHGTGRRESSPHSTGGRLSSGAPFLQVDADAWCGPGTEHPGDHPHYYDRKAASRGETAGPVVVVGIIAVVVLVIIALLATVPGLWK